MNPAGRRFLVAIATILPVALLLPMLALTGASNVTMQMAAVVMFTAAFTVNDVILRDRSLPLGPLLRRRITSNLIMMAVCAVVMTIILPFPDMKEGAPSQNGTTREKAVAPRAEDASTD